MRIIILCEVIPLKYLISKLPLQAIQQYITQETGMDFFDVILTINAEEVGTILYRPLGESDHAFEELDIWYGSLLDYANDYDLKKMMLIHLINDTRREIETYEEQLLGLTEAELAKRWIHRRLTPN
ncbi:hypothetical protein N0M98_29475 [Paenibacillus doosanensis]|uniref:Uncharacterized protein n=1 Tax=Paenibacillus konkukensis TaxID=2020716 RepID=A0ABY4RV76_9BACL|nr:MULTISPECIES: hypothetical protein [Paenibacillus]MCS7464237.1 hypothetical protein [Paenibacillus doosanensis]UQZ85571.1 hypothetical protein SK3146_04860 [Paenibacillus konkukensis]